MRTDIVLAGVGGQGVLTMAELIAKAARAEGLQVKQGENHGMSQRGGAVQASLRLSDRTIESDLVPHGTANLLLSMEPLETLRYVDWLEPEGMVVASADPVRNFPEYPALEGVLARLRALPHVVVVEAEKLARHAGSPKGANLVLVGAASPYLPVSSETIEGLIRAAFAAKGDRIVEANLRAFRSGRETVPCRTS